MKVPENSQSLEQVMEIRVESYAQVWETGQKGLGPEVKCPGNHFANLAVTARVVFTPVTVCATVHKRNLSLCKNFLPFFSGLLGCFLERKQLSF